MRTASLLLVAGVLGLALAAAIRWSGPRGRDAALETPEPAREAPVRESLRATAGRAAEERRAAPPVFESSLLEEPDASRATAEASAGASASRSAGRALSVARVRETLATAIETHLPDLVLSEKELDDLARATLRLRSAQAALRVIPKTREHADRRALERRRLEEAVADFTYLVEMTPAEFTRRVDPEVGVDPWSPDAVPDDVSIRPIRNDETSE